MNKKGFTLIEILAVISLIGVIFFIVIPSLGKVSNKIKSRDLEAKKEALLSVAEVYANNNQSEFGNASYLKIKVRTLLYYGYINSEKECDEKIGCIVNPINDSSMNDEIITIRKVRSVSKATWGDYEPENTISISFVSNGLNKELFELNAVDDENYSIENYADGNRNITFYMDLSQCKNELCEFNTSIINTVREGFEIKGWALGSDSVEEKYKLGEKISISSKTDNQKYYAISKKDVTINFDPNGGTISNDSATCTIWNSNNFCLIYEPSITKKGYTLLYWTDENENVIEFEDEGISLTRVTDNHTFYANWTEARYIYDWKGTLTFKKDGEYCVQKCELICNNMPAQFVRNSVTYDLECITDGYHEYNDEERDYMVKFMKSMLGKTKDYGCTRSCSLQYEQEDLKCGESYIRFSEVVYTKSQDKCKIEEITN